MYARTAHGGFTITRPNKDTPKRGNKPLLAVIILTLLLFTSITMPIWSQYEVDIYVTGKHQIIRDGGRIWYTVITDKGNFENGPVWILGKRDCAAVQDKLVIDSYYTARVCGYQVDWLRMKPNIISVQERVHP